MTTVNEITKTQEDGESETIIEPIDTVRYLGHIAGSGDTTTEAWEKAFSTLRVRLVLAEAKTNSFQQRAAIANAIIIPKIMCVARHAWPTEDVIKRADLSIRNYVWKSKFMVPDRPPAGWIQANVAKLNPRKGGIGIPDIQVELMALSTTMVGDWALAQNTQLQLVGDILQVRDTGTTKWLVPMQGTPKQGPQGTIWETGRPWAALHWHTAQGHVAENGDEIRKMRAALRHSKGVTTRWSNEGILHRRSATVTSQQNDTRTEGSVVLKPSQIFH